MNLELSRNLQHKDEDSDMVFEDELPMSIKISKLAQNQHRLLLDCDKKGNPALQQTSSLSLKRNRLNISSIEEVVRNSTQANSENSNPKPPQGLGVILKKSSNQDRIIILLCNYNPKHKTYPRGILKSEKKRKFSNRDRNCIKEMTSSYSSISKPTQSRSRFLSSNISV